MTEPRGIAHALIVAVVVLFAGAACGGGEKVGEQFEDFEGEGGDERIGGVAATQKPKAKAAAKKPAQQQPAATPPPRQAVTKTPAPQQQQAAVDIRITNSGFDPTNAQVTQGGTVKVTNTDSAAHTYTSSDAVYDTGQIAPGASKTFQASRAGTFQIEDRTRNWIIGSLKVVPR